MANMKNHETRIFLQMLSPGLCLVLIFFLRETTSDLFVDFGISMLRKYISIQIVIKFKHSAAIIIYLKIITLHSKYAQLVSIN